jgi:hypothetical protein
MLAFMCVQHGLLRPAMFLPDTHTSLNRCYMRERADALYSGTHGQTALLNSQGLCSAPRLAEPMLTGLHALVDGVGICRLSNGHAGLTPTLIRAEGCTFWGISLLFVGSSCADKPLTTGVNS